MVCYVNHVIDANGKEIYLTTITVDRTSYICYQHYEILIWSVPLIVVQTQMKSIMFILISLKKHCAPLCPALPAYAPLKKHCAPLCPDGENKNHSINIMNILSKSLQTSNIPLASTINVFKDWVIVDDDDWVVVEKEIYIEI